MMPIDFPSLQFIWKNGVAKSEMRRACPDGSHSLARQDPVPQYILKAGTGGRQDL